MADKRLIDNESSTTVDKFYGNKGGKDVQIPLADAASVLAEQIVPLKWVGQTDNLDNVKTGFGYYIGEPNGLFISITHQMNDDYRLQLRVRDNGSALYFRTKFGYWSEWKEL